jgi:hypothetical protein
VKKLEGGLLGAGLLVAAWLAYGEANRRSHAGGVEREARVELVRFALGMAKMCRPFPETGARVPARLRDVSAKTYESRAEDWEQPAFKCANFRVEDAQHLQYRWLKESDVSGRVEARADIDGDGTPDTWYEVPITCEAESCQAPNYVVAVKEDGERLPPLLLRILGQAAPYSGERPSSQPGDTQPMTGAAGSALPPPPPPPVIAKGAAIPLDVLFVEAERRAASKLPSAVLLELEATKVEQRVADPAKGTELRASYGAPDGKGKVARGAELVSVTFDAEGLSEQLVKAPRELRRLGTVECMPEKLFGLAGLAPPVTMALSYDAQRGRPLWRLKSGESPERLFNIEQCAGVK